MRSILDISLSRRAVLAGAAASAATLASASAQARVSERDVEYGSPLNEFAYGDVQLGAGPHLTQLKQTHEVLMGLDEDSLLRPYRIAAGLPAPGSDLGGWYNADGFCPGATFGQWISALSRYAAITGDEESRSKIGRLLNGLAATIDPNGRYYALSSSSRDPVPAYAFDKLVCGLMDAHTLAQQPNAPELLERLTDTALPHLPGHAIEWHDRYFDETYTVPENQLIAWQRGAQDRHLQLAQDYLHHEFFDALAQGQNVLPGRHAYSHMNALSSAAKAYLVYGDRKYLDAARNGFTFVEAQSFATGGWGPWEAFTPGPAFGVPSVGFQVTSPGESVVNSHYHFETPCGSYAHFKLTRYLLRITKSSYYGDSMERVMYNCALGALPLTRFGRAFYQSDYHRYARKEYFDGYLHSSADEWPCCSGTMPQMATDYGISAYFRNRRGVYVNLYIPSTLRWSQGGATAALSQQGSYPLSDEVAFALELSAPARFSLYFRIPEWAKGASLRVNGTVAYDARPGGFAEIRREWRSGDRVEVTMPRAIELVPVDREHPDLVALRVGPIVLFAIGDDLPPISRSTLMSARQVAPGSAEWRSDQVRFLPWWTIKQETYTTYHDVS